MSTPSSLHPLRRPLWAELTERLLPYWIHNTPDRRRGGFIGAIDSQGRVDPEAGKGAVLHARILWTFSVAARLLDSASCRQMADRAYDYLVEHFWDPEHGGIYWMLDAHGCPTHPKKQVYAQAFAIYALAEYHRATKRPESVNRARQLFELLERYAHDGTYGGYTEAFGREWGPLADVSLGDNDPNERKSMNTSLHVLEAYTNLYRVWSDEAVANRLGEMIEVFLHRILDRDTHHLHCFFDEAWTPRSNRVSYGHDIEASWLLGEAAEVGAPALRAEVESVAVPMADAVLREGVGAAHGIVNEAEGTTVVDADRHWWPQAEALVGFVNAYQCSGDERFVEAAHRTWAFIEDWMLDRTYGEWYFRVSEQGEPYSSDNKVGPWKGPYHTARACFEVLRRVNGLPASDSDRAVLASTPRH